ncbi:sulfotransferase family 2 domain-containing protein, partial [Pseudophaeobacter sp.]|uniref:sulfotransferase family 2 domain-containing protein n=1 Tax=Pseudophaeobacter sp. TaxID=1971739 RepID=UPI00405A422C
MPIFRINDKLIYFAHVPRCAGSAVENYMQQRFGPPAFLDRRYLALPENRRWTKSSPQHVDRYALRQLFPEGFFDASFAIVRNPADRIFSVFLRQRDIEQTLPLETKFEDWLDTLPHPDFTLDNHTRLMLDFLPAGCRIFQLEKGLSPVVEWLDNIAGDASGPRDIKIVNSHEQKLKQTGHAGGLTPALTSEVRNLVLDKYASDMTWFGYSIAKDIPPMIPDTSTRTVILHYHLFKNAGTSLDQILKRNFGDRWVTREFSMKGGDNSAQLADWIREEKDAVAFSTHTGAGPVPEIEGVRVVSVMLLRDPIVRIRSAYQFERKQCADTLGARLAKEVDFETYVRTRLEMPHDRQCRNFHTHRLASMVPGADPEL